MTNSVPHECLSLANDVDGLKADKTALQEDLQDAGPSQKPAIIQQINQLNHQIAQKQAELDHCIASHPQPSEPPPPALPRDCAKLQGEIDALVIEAHEDAEDLQDAGPTEKPFIVRQIKKVLAELAKKEKEFDRCMIAHGYLPDLLATLTGRVTLTTNNPQATGPWSRPVNLGILFQKWDHKQWLVVSFPAIVVGPYNTPAGSNTTTITAGAAGGWLDPPTGTMQATLPLHFAQSNTFANDSDAKFNLITWGPGASPLDDLGNVGLSGNATFVDGFLDGNVGTLAVSGVILPHP